MHLQNLVLGFTSVYYFDFFFSLLTVNFVYIFFLCAYCLFRMSKRYNSPPDRSGSVRSDCWTWTLQNEKVSHLQVTVHFYIKRYYKGIHVSNLISFFSRLSAKLKVNL